jgi:hypothetical protein
MRSVQETFCYSLFGHYSVNYMMPVHGSSSFYSRLGAWKPGVL